jgi:hypothetical protein
VISRGVRSHYVFFLGINIPKLGINSLKPKVPEHDERIVEAKKVV